MNTPIPGVDGALLALLQDPIEALCLARQIDREAADPGESITTSLQNAAVDLICGDHRNEECHEPVRQS